MSAPAPAAQKPREIVLRECTREGAESSRDSGEGFFVMWGDLTSTLTSYQTMSTKDFPDECSFFLRVKEVE